MNEDEMPTNKASLLRSKLHIRCGIRRLQQKKYSAGIATIYDAIIAGVRWLISIEDHLKIYNITPIEDLHNEENRYFTLKKFVDFNQLGMNLNNFTL
jgi:hypothetical protein